MKQVENRKYSEGENDVKNILKKNQLMITALAIMIAVAGYLQFTGKNLSLFEISSDNFNHINWISI